MRGCWVPARLKLFETAELVLRAPETPKDPWTPMGEPWQARERSLARRLLECSQKTQSSYQSLVPPSCTAPGRLPGQRRLGSARQWQWGSSQSASARALALQKSLCEALGQHVWCDRKALTALWIAFGFVVRSQKRSQGFIYAS